MILRSAAATCALILCGAAAQAATIVQTFGPTVDLNDGPGSVAFTLAGLDPNVASDLTIDFTFFGDLNSSIENFELFLDGTSYGVGCDNNAANGNFGSSVTFGPFSFDDVCSQSNNSLTDASLLVTAVDALGLLADGALEIAFNFTSSVNDFVDITNGGEVRSGVFFGNTNNASFGAGGTVTYESADLPSPVPVPPSLPLLVAGLAGLAGLRLRQAA
ncbi:MAG: hypothetical protein AAFP98_11415 [Pseudomonadota bacterium]